jgi:hypothetical protein
MRLSTFFGPSSAVIASFLLVACVPSAETVGPKSAAPAASPAASKPAVPHVAATVAHATTIEYQGQEIRASRAYSNFDTYKNDPNNLEPGDRRRAQALMQSAKVPDRCTTIHEVIDVVMDLEFPGYGTGGYGGPLGDGRTLYAGSVEIPGAAADRYIVYLGSDGAGYDLVDDTVLPEAPYVHQVMLHDGKVTYLTEKGDVIVAHPVRPPHP